MLSQIIFATAFYRVDLYVESFSVPLHPSLAQVPGVARAGVGPVQSGDSVSWPVWWLPVRVPGTWCGPEVQEGQTHRPEYVAAATHVSRANLLTPSCAFLTFGSFFLQSPQMTQWSTGVRRCCWTLGSPTTWAVCLGAPNRPRWSSGSKTGYLWTAP